jgi:hypothetical protein
MAGANAGLKDKSGKSAYDYTKAEGNKKGMSMLKGPDSAGKMTFEENK